VAARGTRIYHCVTVVIWCIELVSISTKIENLRAEKFFALTYPSKVSNYEFSQYEEEALQYKILAAKPP
jgi:hypothetical protein